MENKDYINNLYEYPQTPYNLLRRVVSDNHIIYFFISFILSIKSNSFWESGNCTFLQNKDPLSRMSSKSSSFKIYGRYFPTSLFLLFGSQLTYLSGCFSSNPSFSATGCKIVEKINSSPQ